MEIIRISNLQARISKLSFQRHYLYECPLIVLVTEGRCQQWIDFEPVDCHRGRFLLIKVGQVHSLGNDSEWDGYMLLLRPEGFIQNDHVLFLLALPSICSLNNRESTLFETSLKQMHEDSLLPYSEQSSMLLRFQLYTLAVRLNLLVTGQNGTTISTKSSQCFQRFQQLLEQHFKVWHSPVKYAEIMECSEKTLSRVCLNNNKLTAKQLITKRLILECKRLLCYSEMSISEITELLGFSETTYFCKFFKRETRLSPSAFRNCNRLIEQC